MNSTVLALAIASVVLSLLSATVIVIVAVRQVAYRATVHSKLDTIAADVNKLLGT